MLKRPILAAEAKANHVARRGKLNQSYRYMSDYLKTVSKVGALTIGLGEFPDGASNEERA